MKYFLFTLACAFAYRLICNVRALLWLNFYSKKYRQYLENTERGFAENEAAVTKLFKEAGLTDRQVPFIQPIGYGQILQGHTLLFSNMENRREDIVEIMLSCFASARGAYKNRIIENFSPIFWINCALFLPRTILTYMGVSADSFFSKLLQLIYWIATPLFVLLRDNLYELIRLFFQEP